MSGSLFPKAFTYYTRTGSRVNGVWTSTGSVSFMAYGSIQPASARDFEALPEGRTDRGMIKIYTDADLHVSSRGSTAPGDIVAWHGRNWEVVARFDNDNGLLPHVKYLATETEAQP